MRAELPKEIYCNFNHSLNDNSILKSSSMLLIGKTRRCLAVLLKGIYCTLNHILNDNSMEHYREEYFREWCAIGNLRVQVPYAPLLGKSTQVSECFLISGIGTLSYFLFIAPSLLLVLCMGSSIGNRLDR